LKGPTFDNALTVMAKDLVRRGLVQDSRFPTLLASVSFAQPRHAPNLAEVDDMLLRLGTPSVAR
jgi:hypothetical protein